MPGTDPAAALAQQVALYGEPLGERFARVLRAYAIPQARLAATIGLSAPMLSQLATGQRVKISNPAVYARLQRLEELAQRPEVAGGDADARRVALDEVAGSRPRLTTQVATPDHEHLTAALAALAASQELAAAARAVPGSALGRLLGEAAERARPASFVPRDR